MSFFGGRIFMRRSGEAAENRNRALVAKFRQPISDNRQQFTRFSCWSPTRD
jgi:hypothetical protein